MKLLILCLLIGLTHNLYAQTEMTIINTSQNTQSVEVQFVPQKKMRSKHLKDIVLKAAKKAVYMEWDEVRRVFYTEKNVEQHYDIKKMTIKNNKVTYMEVIFFGFLKYEPEDFSQDQLPFSCNIEITKNLDINSFEPLYAYCIIDDSEEVEFTN